MTCSHFGSSPTHIYSLRDSVLKLLDMPSEVDLAKRELVKVLRALAAKYKVTLSLTRESSNQDVRLDVFNMRVWMCLRQGNAPCLRHIHTRILKTSKRLSPFKRLNAPFYSCSHADSPTDVRSPRVDKTTVLPPTPTQSGLRQAPPATIQCGPRQIQANFNLVIVLPESDSLVTQVDIGGGRVGKWPSGPQAKTIA